MTGNIAYLNPLTTKAAICIESVRLLFTQSTLYLTCFKGRLSFLNFFRQPEARLNRDQSVHGDRTNRPTWFIKSISIFLFLAPDYHLKSLQKMWVDKIMYQSAWEAFLKKLTDEWRESVLYVSHETQNYYILFLDLLVLQSTVVLNADMAFLAMNSVDTNRNPYRSPAQISSYCSMSFSIGSIILGLILVRQNQTKYSEPILHLVGN